MLTDLNQIYNRLMVKRSFVRINVDYKQFKVDRKDIVHTHFVKKRINPRIPAFGRPPKSLTIDIEQDSETVTVFETHHQ